jgi:glycerol-3-phosphate O-acyltransferase
MQTLSEAYGGLIKELLQVVSAPARITPENVYQGGNNKLLPYLVKLVEDLALPGSCFSGAENLLELWKKAEEGASCLILPEHYCNTDLPTFFYFLGKALPDMADTFYNNIVAIAGRKLNEENPAVAAFASAYSRLVICPSRELPLIDGKKDEEERLRVIQINRAAMLTMNRMKREHKMILVFPAGTRYRPWDPASKRGVREMDSYIKTFDYMCHIAINGEILRVRPGGMIDDYVAQDVVRLTASPVIPCSEFRRQAKAEAEAAGVEDVKQAIVDKVMANLEKLHVAAEVERQKILGGSGGDGGRQQAK